MIAPKVPRKLWWIVAGVAVCAGIASVDTWSGDTPGLVTVTTLSRGDIEDSVSTAGTVVPVVDFLGRATNGGMVQEVLVKVGDHVQPGQLLVIMKDPFAESRVASAVAALRASQVGMENTRMGGSQEDRIQFSADRRRLQGERDSAERNLATMTALLSTGSASQAEVSASHRRLEADDLNLETLEKRMTKRYASNEAASWRSKVFEEEQIVNAERTNLGNVRVTSTISGTAYLIPANTNDFLGAGAELIHVADLTKLQVRADFDEQDMGKLRKGEPVLLRWDGRPDKVWHGSIERAPLASTSSGTRHVGLSIISVEDAKGDLPPHSTVSVTASVETRRQVQILPREALHVEHGERVIYRVVNGRLKRTPVLTGLITLDRFEVRGGVSPADQIALHRMDNQDLAANTQVKIVQ